MFFDLQLSGFENYIMSFFLSIKASSPDLELEKLKLDSKREQRQNTSKLSSKKTKKPWRGSDPHPKDMIRYNYLDNTDDYTKR